MARHLRFISRTLMVKDGDVDATLIQMTRFLGKEGFLDSVAQKRYHEKPCRMRLRKDFESCKRIYGMEMGRKISFIRRTYREDPWQGC